MAKRTKFSPGEKWLCDRDKEGKESFIFLIVGQGTNGVNKPSSTHKVCRLVALPGRPGLRYGETESTYSHSHLKKHAVHIVDES